MRQYKEKWKNKVIKKKLIKIFLTLHFLGITLFFHLSHYLFLSFSLTLSLSLSLSLYIYIYIYIYIYTYIDAKCLITDKVFSL